MYEVVHFFTDLQDGNHAYPVGAKYPRQGLTVTDERIKELSGRFNKQGVPLIKLVETKEVLAEKVGTESEPISSVKTYTKTEINRLSKDDLVKLATERGIENAADMSGVDLKTKLIDILV